MKTRLLYLPLESVRVGMVLGSESCSVRGGAESFSLPKGHCLTEENLNQMQAHSVECVTVLQPDLRSDQAVADDMAMSARQLLLVFQGANLGDAAMSSLFEEVLAFRVSQ